MKAKTVSNLARSGEKRGVSKKRKSPQAGEWTTLPRADRERLARLRRFELQDHAARLLPAERVRGCMRRLSDVADGVEGRYHPATHSAHYRGLQTCGSVWHCPICAAKISERRRDELTRLVEKHIAAGGSVWMTTYTIQHSRFDDLADLLKRFLEARRKMRQGRRGLALRHDFQVRGTVSVLEVTWSKEHGWHPHVHELVFSSEKHMNPQAYDQAARSAWRDAAKSQGLSMNEHGFQIDRTYGAVQDYITKYGHEPEGKPWGVESEMVKGHTKQGRGEQHLTPFGLLGAIADGFEELAPRFQEYAAVFKGRKQLNFSPGLKACYQEEEKTDEELAAEGEKDEYLTLVYLPDEQWEQVVKQRRRGGLLEAIRTGKVGDIVEGLAEIGIDTQPPDMRNWRVATPAGDGSVLSVVYETHRGRWRCSVMLDQAENGRRWRAFDLREVVVIGGDPAERDNQCSVERRPERCSESEILSGAGRKRGRRSV
jgi:Replication protein